MKYLGLWVQRDMDGADGLRMAENDSPGATCRPK